MKIDIFTHIMPERYKKAVYKYQDLFVTERNVQANRQALWEFDRRERILDEFDDITEVLSITMPPLELIVGTQEAADLAKMGNDEMAEIVAKNPRRYIAAIANLPMNNMDAALKEAERAITQLGFKGIQVYTSVQGKPLSSEEFMPLYALMTKFDLPIWIHPYRGPVTVDYPTETQSTNQIFSIFGWPFDTTAAMVRLVFAGVLEKYPTIKFITHHLGGMVPYFADRIIAHYDNGLQRLGAKHFPGLTKHPIEYLRMFYGDTALNGNPWALRCGFEFFGEDHVVFASDTPYDVENGRLSMKTAIDAIEAMGVSETARQKIYEGNARRLLHL